MGYNMKKGAAPKFKELGDSQAPLKQKTDDTDYKNVIPADNTDVYPINTVTTTKKNSYTIIPDKIETIMPANWRTDIRYNPSGNPNAQFMLGNLKPGTDAANSSVNFHNNIIASSIPIGKGGKFMSKFFKPKTPVLNPKTLTQRDLNAAQKFLKNTNPWVKTAAVSWTSSKIINDVVESSTEKSHTENSAKLSKIVSDKNSRKKIQDENVRLEFKDRGLNQKETYTKRDKYYSDFKKNNPTLKNHPYTYLSDKKSEHYNPDFSNLQNRIYKIHEAGILRGGSGEAHRADTSAGNPTYIHK